MFQVKLEMGGEIGGIHLELGKIGGMRGDNRDNMFMHV
jgi:hypothetical protein